MCGGVRFVESNQDALFAIKDEVDDDEGTVNDIIYNSSPKVVLLRL